MREAGLFDERSTVPLPGDDRAGFRFLLGRSLHILGFCTVLVTFAYFFIDKPVARGAYDYGLNQYDIFKWMTYIPLLLQALAPLMIVWAVIHLAWRPLPRLERTLFAASVSLLITLVFKDHLKFVFGRYWPDTWIHNNPSLLRNGAYGFHPFHGGIAYASFPSGHAARIFSVMSIVWIAYPRWRWLCVVGCASVIIGLLGMNYHFVSDIVAGASLGCITGMYAAHFFRLDSSRERHRVPDEETAE